MLSTRATLINAVAPIFVPANSNAVAVIRAERIFTEHQRKGFFRIGVLPMRVAEGVVVELRDKERVLESLREMEGWLKAPGKGKAVELRRISFKLAGSECQLRAGRARLTDSGQWELLDGVDVVGSSGKITVPQARLQMTGADAGRLIGIDQTLPNLLEILSSGSQLTARTESNPSRSP